MKYQTWFNTFILWGIKTIYNTGKVQIHSEALSMLVFTNFSRRNA